MSLSFETIDRKKRDPKPIFYCTNGLHYRNRWYIKPEDIERCTIDGCSCNQINGWVATCPECGTILHNCLYGCSQGIPIQTAKKQKWIERRVCVELALHSRFVHPNRPMTLEF